MQSPIKRQQTAPKGSEWHQKAANGTKISQVNLKIRNDSDSGKSKAQV
jgi:hypothetical protein